LSRRTADAGDHHATGMQGRVRPTGSIGWEVRDGCELGAGARGLGAVRCSAAGGGKRGTGAAVSMVAGGRGEGVHEGASAVRSGER
jgi:hypothetical protein